MTALTTPVESRGRLSSLFLTSRPRLTERTSPWGLELGEDYFVLARLTGRAGVPAVRGGARTRLEGAPPFGDPAGLVVWSRVMRAARQAQSRSASEVVASLPASQVDTFPLRIEATEPRAFIHEVSAQASERLPYPIAEAVVDCIDPGDTPVPGSGRRVILVAARASVVEFALRCLHQAGFEPIAIEIPATALARLEHVAEPAQDITSLVVSPGDSSTTITCVRGGTVLVTRSIPWGVSTILERLESTLRIPRTAALRFVAEFRPETEGVTRPASGDRGSVRAQRVLGTLLSPLLEELASEVEKVCTYARADLRSVAPRRTLLSGQATLIPAIENYLQGLAPEPITVLDPLARFATRSAEHRDTATASGSALAVPLGLALRDSPWFRSN